MLGSLTFTGADQLRPPSTEWLTSIGRPVVAKHKRQSTAVSLALSQVANSSPVLASTARLAWNLSAPATWLGVPNERPRLVELSIQRLSGRFPGPESVSNMTRRVPDRVNIPTGA